MMDDKKRKARINSAPKAKARTEREPNTSDAVRVHYYPVPVPYKEWTPEEKARDIANVIRLTRNQYLRSRAIWLSDQGTFHDIEQMDFYLKCIDASRKRGRKIRGRRRRK